MATMTVGIVGLGLLGHAVASRLRGAGYRLVGFDVLAERRHAFAELGGEVLGSAADVARAAEGVCTLLPSRAAVEDVVLGSLVGAAPAGTTDLHLIQDAARAVGAPLPLTDVAERRYGAARDDGHGGEDLAVVVRAVARLATARD